MGRVTYPWVTHGIFKSIVGYIVQVQMVIVARNFLLPYVFTVAQYAEKFHPRTALKMMLVRYHHHTHRLGQFRVSFWGTRIIDTYPSPP